MRDRLRLIRETEAFTLVEILVVLVLTGIVTMVIYFMFITQNRAFSVQAEVAAMQQNLRAATDLMEKEIRLAGYDPSGDANPVIKIANDDELEFEWDEDKIGKSTSNASIRYELNDDGDLGRDTGAGLQPMAENIDVLNFVYLDRDNVPTTEVRDIRTIQVTLVAKTDKPDLNYTDRRSYQNLQGEEVLPVQSDHHRRQLLTATIKCRNLGLD